MVPSPRAPRAKPKVGARPNPIKAIQDQEWRKQQGLVRSVAASASPPPRDTANTTASNKSRCPNKNCKNPNVVDGTCRSCGRVADDSNIVAEIQFGETSQGAAVVQGSYIGPDQGGARMGGAQGGRRIAGTNTSIEAREKALREARNHISGFAHQLNLPERTVNGAFQLYKLASSRNFTQGRPSHLVAAMCLYAACRKEQSCKIMLIDLADLVKHDVFHLGRMYKAFTSDIGAGSVYHPIFVEDLIYRFAARLEFGDQTNKVAETAIRLVQRMDRDWMVMGRRPSGICGACLILAARMNNFRRTVREVVFFAKVTMHTLQQRLDEFAAVPSAKMTVEDFLLRDFLYDQMDPPSFYKHSEEYRAKLKEKRNKRKRLQEDDGEEERRVDSDGFVIPPIPDRASRAGSRASESGDLEEEITNVESHLEDLARQFGPTTPSGTAPEGAPSEASPSTTGGTSLPASKPRKYPQGSSCRKKPKIEKPAYVTEEWDEDEELLEMEITENMMNPATTEGALRLANAQELAALKLLDGAGPSNNGQSGEGDGTPQTRPLDDPNVAEDEFADDPEVMYCLLSKEEAELKTQLWVNQNKDWMRKQQEKEFKRRLAEANPKPARGAGGKPRRPRIGEGQTSPAESATDATLEMMDRRQFSKRIDYEAVRSMLSTGGPGSAGGSLATSRQTSRAGSLAPQTPGSGDDDDEDEEEEEEEEEEGEGEEEQHQQLTPAPTAKTAAAEENDEEEEDYDEDDGAGPTEADYDEDGYDEAPDYDDDVEPEIDPFADD